MRSVSRFSFAPPAPFDLAATVRTHGWVELAPWRWDGATLARAERIGGAIGALAIRQAATGRVTVTWRGVRDVGVTPLPNPPPQGGRGKDGDPPPLRGSRRRERLQGGRGKSGRSEADSAAVRGAVRAAVARALSWDWDAAEFLARARRLDQRCHDLVARGGGRLLRGTSFYEDFVKTVCTVNTTWAGTVRMAERLVGRVGGGAFPTPGQVLAAGADALQAECGLGYRAAPLVRATELLLEARALDADGHGRADALGYEALLALPGIGPYAAAHCRVLLHDFSRLPIDSSVTAHMAAVLARKQRTRKAGRKTSAHAALEAHFARWGEFRFLGYRLAKVAARLAAGDDYEW